MITRLVLKNWRSHEDSEFEFAAGTNVLIGQMGSGKSAAINAICFALFGTFPDLQQKKLKLDDLIMNKPAVKTQAHVLIEFNANGKKYSVKREITRGKGVTSSSIRENDVVTEHESTKRVTDKVCEALKMDYDLFSRAVFSEQNAIDYFLEIPKSQRKQKIDELLKIDRFENARKNLTTVINRLRDKKQSLEAFSAERKETSNIQLIEEEISSLTSKAQSIEGLLSKEQRSLETLRVQFEKIAAKKEKYNHATTRIKQNEGKTSIFRKKIDACPPFEESEVEAKNLAEKLFEQRTEIVGKQQAIQKLEKELEKTMGLAKRGQQTLETQKKRLKELSIEKDASVLEKRFDEVEKELERIMAESAAHQSKISEIEESLAKLSSGRNKCPVCDSHLTEEKIASLVQQRNEEKKTSKEVISISSAKINNLVAARRAVKNELDDFVRQKEEARLLEEGIQANEKEILAELKNEEGLKQKIAENKIEKSLDAVDTELKRLETILDCLAAQRDLKAVEYETLILSKELGVLAYDEKEEKTVFDSLKNAEKSLALMAREKQNAYELLTEKQKRLSELQKIQQEVLRSREEAAFLEKNVESFQLLKKVLEESQTILRHEFTDAVNVALGDIWKKVYPYGDYESLRLGVDEAGEYVLQVQSRSGAWTNVEGITSGGERSTACLALRISLSLVLAQNLSWLVLDEPTHNLDRQGISELSHTLKEHLPRIVSQIFLITHEEELESAASGFLYRLERKKEEDEPTKIVLESSAA